MTDPTDKLAEQILADARKQAEPLKKRAEREAEAALHKAQEEAERERLEVIQRAERTAESNTKRMRARADLEVQNIRRQAREQVLIRARERALQKLIEMARSPRYADQLTGLAVAALQAMNGRRFELLMRAEDREPYGAGAAKAASESAERELGRRIELKVSDETIDGSGGLIVRSSDGHQVADQTFEARLGRLWAQLRDEIAGELLPE